MPVNGVFFKIIADPYYKHISIEKYVDGKWDSVVYDSSRLDFRKMNERDQRAWQKEVLVETADSVECLIRDQDDRIVFLEKHSFKNNVPIECQVFSPNGILLATQKMHYTEWGSAFNGVTLSDSLERLVLKKTYDFDPQTFEFTTLMSEDRGEK